MSDQDRLKRILSAIAVGADHFAGGASGTERMIVQAASGILHAVAAATEHRTPEEVRRLLLDLGQNPAPKLGDVVAEDDEHIDTAISKIRHP